MPQFTVYLQQYVEMVAKTVVEAEDAEQARDKALDRVRQAPAGGIEWGGGDDAYKAEAYLVTDEADETVWER